jgi:protein-tyrosine phosphatase
MIQRRDGDRQEVNRLTNIVAYWLGARRYRRVDWKDVRRLVFVCKGNIARSAYGAARARALGFDAVSFGVQTHDDKQADPSAMRVAQDLGLDLSRHRTTSLPSASLRAGDLILTMEPYQARRVHPLAARVGAQVSLLGMWCTQSQPMVFDPYGKSDLVFRQCFDQIDDGLRNIRNHLRVDLPA